MDPPYRLVSIKETEVVGFKDGFYGFVISVNSAYAVFLRYVKLRNIYRTQKHI